MLDDRLTEHMSDRNNFKYALKPHNLLKVHWLLLAT